MAVNRTDIEPVNDHLEKSRFVSRRRWWQCALEDFMLFGCGMIAYLALDKLHDAGHAITGIIVSGVLCGLLFAFIRSLSR
jgi:hypothetical protein